ncbi:MAG: dynamin family protein [Vibrio sp.]
MRRVKEFKEQIIKVSETSNSYKGSLLQFESELNDITRGIEQFTAYLPVIGMFSAGKSSLLNAWMENDLLPEDQDATTAISTELHFAPETTMKIIQEDGSSCNVVNLPSDAEEANMEDVSKGVYAICTVDSARLQSLKGIIPVDMPGTDSNIERHTEALYRYAHKGNAYLLVLDAATGTIPASLMAFLSELDLSNKMLLIALHKSDKYSVEHLEDVKGGVLNQCSDLLGITPNLIFTSDRDEDTPERLQKMFTGLNVEQLCISQFTPDFNKLTLRLLNHIEDIRNSSELDTTQLTKKMQSLLEVNLDIENTIKNEEATLSQQLQTTTLNNVINDISSELYQNLDILCEMADSGDQHTFTNKITGIVNRVCEESLQRNVAANIEVVASKIEKSVSISSEELANTLRTGVTGANHVMEGILKVVKEGSKTYRTVTIVLAITTSVVMPVIELLIIFLPDIIQYLSNPEEKRRRIIREKLVNEVFPKVKSQIRQELKKQMPEIEHDILQQLRDSWQQRIEDAKSALDACRKQKEDQEKDWKLQQQSCNQDIKKLRQILETINA